MDPDEPIDFSQKVSKSFVSKFPLKETRRKVEPELSGIDFLKRRNSIFFWRKAKRRGIDTAVTPPFHESEECFNFEDGVSYIACNFTYNNVEAAAVHKALLGYAKGTRDGMSKSATEFLENYSPCYQGLRTLRQRLKDLSNCEEGIAIVRKSNDTPRTESLIRGLRIPQKIKDQISNEVGVKEIFTHHTEDVVKYFYSERIDAFRSQIQSNSDKYCPVCCMMNASEGFQRSTKFEARFALMPDSNPCGNVWHQHAKEESIPARQSEAPYWNVAMCWRRKKLKTTQMQLFPLQPVNQPSGNSLTPLQQFQLQEVGKKATQKRRSKPGSHGFSSFVPGWSRRIHAKKLTSARYLRSVLLNENRGIATNMHWLSYQYARKLQTAISSFQGVQSRGYRNKDEEFDLKDLRVVQSLSSVFNKIRGFKQYWEVVKIVSSFMWQFMDHQLEHWWKSVNRTTTRTPQLAGASKTLAIIGLVSICVFFSFLLSVFLSKYRGYPYSFLFA
ncbi:unnamed protein product [Caenorhabditis sp. 36 PRJEB53466]|nr:unnamed protein product [Caenorhabditis sp. 36 PRJEB53466]